MIEQTALHPDLQLIQDIGKGKYDVLQHYQIAIDMFIADPTLTRIDLDGWIYQVDEVEENGQKKYRVAWILEDPIENFT